MSDTFEKRKQSTADGRRRAILITGAASGMGREAALLFSKQGWFVVAFDINLEDFGGNAELQERVRPGLKSLEKELGGSANVYIRKVDVANKADFDAAVADLEKKLPGLTGAKSAACSVDVCFANAGIARFGLFATSPFEYHEAVMNINFKGVINTIYDSLNLMKENRGALVFSTSSSSAMYGIPGLAIYSATKHAVKGLTEALSIELDSLYGIRAADTLPGIIRTNLIPEAWVDGAVKDGPWRLIEAKEIADALWASWLDDPSAVDGKGMSTVGRLHWYIPEELQEDTDALVNVRGGAEKVRETVRARFQSPEDAIGQLDKK